METSLGVASSKSRGRAATISRLTSGVICSWTWTRRSSSSASFCSELMSCLYRWAKVRKAWCHKTGSVRRSVLNLQRRRFGDINLSLSYPVTFDTISLQPSWHAGRAFDRSRLFSDLDFSTLAKQSREEHAAPLPISTLIELIEARFYCDRKLKSAESAAKSNSHHILKLCELNYNYRIFNKSSHPFLH